jgi:hypothetical protein
MNILRSQYSQKAYILPLQCFTCISQKKTHVCQNITPRLSHVDIYKFINTGVPSYPLIQYPCFQLSAVHRSPKKLEN